MVDNVTAHVFTKLDFVTYYEAVATGRPLRWVFHASSGQPAQFDVMGWDEEGVAAEPEWQAPSYCFQDKLDHMISLDRSIYKGSLLDRTSLSGLAVRFKGSEV